jgi:imidazolonepropionase-like amidohydrolase
VSDQAWTVSIYVQLYQRWQTLQPVRPGDIVKRHMVRMSLVLSCVVTASALGTTQGPPSMTIRAGRLMDGRGGVARNVVIRIEGQKIVSVAPDRTNATVTHDLSRATVLPGWIDTHVHVDWHFGKDGRYQPSGDTPDEHAAYAAENAKAMLMAGFTTVQSVGSITDVRIRDAVAQGQLPGPRILTSIRSFSRGTPEELRAGISKVKAEGADVIKIFASESIRTGGKQSMTDEQLQAACGEARAQGLRTLVHAHSTESIKAATLAGCTQIEHGTFATDEVLRLMAERGTYFDPNVGVVLQNYLRNKERYLGIGSYTDEGFASMEQAIPIVRDTFRRALKIPKLKIVLGTDAVAGAHGHNADEAIVRVREGGQKPMDAIVSMTSLAAESLGLKDRIGSVAAGFDADLVAVEGDPIAEISVLKKVVFVMKEGRVYRGS